MTINIPDFQPPFDENEASVRARMETDADPALDTREGSFYQSLTEPQTKEVARVYSALNDALAMAFPMYAFGIYLDYTAAEYGVTRKAATRAEGAVTFTGTPGTFIPLGTRVSVPASSEVQESIYFTTTSEATIGGGGTVTVGIRAESDGGASNVAIGSVTYIEDTINGLASVTNALETNGGSDIEEDEDLRQRVLLEITAPQAAGSVSDHERWMLAQEGVAAVTVVPLWDGPNTVKNVILGAGNNPAPLSVLDRAQEFLTGEPVVPNPEVNPTVDLADHNLLTANQSSLETDTTGWVNITNTTLSRSTAQAATGAASLALTAIAAGNLQASTSIGTSAVPVTPGRTYTAVISSRAATAARTVQTTLRWFDAAGAFLSQSVSGTAPNTTTGWTIYAVTAVAPAGAAFVSISPFVVGAGAAGEVHYFDRAMIREGSRTTYVVGGTSAAGNVPAGTYHYRFTMVDESAGETTNRATAATITFSGSKQVRLDGIPPGGTGVVARRIYRATSLDGPWHMVTELDDTPGPGVTTYTDNTADVSAGRQMPKVNNTTAYLGQAPIGQRITVDTPAVSAINISATIIFAAGYSLDGAGGTIATREQIEAVLEDYVNGQSPGGDVVYNQLLAEFFEVTGVYDVPALTINGVAATLPLDPDEVASLGTVTLS